MKINVIYFGMIAEEIGKNAETLQIKSIQPNVDNLTTYFIQQYPVLKTKSFKIAVNQQMATNNTVINENDEIALLPPFAGG
ncbi:MAG: MoaD/ThiS family protein [Flavobacteriales bacterium]|nr:MoaD/ThiS family protein [Flavobacteriales bacterium]